MHVRVQVYMEVMGRDATVRQALPKAKGSFQRAAADRFTLYSQQVRSHAMPCGGLAAAVGVNWLSA